ncbi:MAG TPA: class I SAM-dependent methyltransferase [Myxococcales bacterium]|nr:class I SAM-dependent methyltransferase [Myxococcales bacterium]
MRLSIRGDGPVERVALAAGLGPFPLALAFHGMAAARAVMAGEELGLYARLARGPATAAELGPGEGVAHLLDALEGLGLLRRASGGRYALSRRAAPWLDPASPTCVADFLRFNRWQWDWWTRLDEVIAGKAPPFDLHRLPPEHPVWPLYARAMLALARVAAPEVARAVRLPRSAAKLLDIGGGHGLYAAEICARRRGLSAVVVDLPGAAREGRALLGALRPGAPVSFVEGDALAGELPEEVDAIYCGQMVRHLSPAQLAALLARFHRVLRPGGTVNVLDTFAPGGEGDPTSGDPLVALHYHLVSGVARFSSLDVERWMREAGFRRLRRGRIRRLPGSTLLSAERAAG